LKYRIEIYRDTMGSQNILFNYKNILHHISGRQGEEGAKKS